VESGLEIMRQEWEAANDAVERLGKSDRVRFERVQAQIDVVLDELRRRVGQTFTLAELARVYKDAERWIRAAVQEHAATPGWPADLTLVQDAAFYAFQRGAVDYAP
jgi:hypothetical protein